MMGHCIVFSKRGDIGWGNEQGSWGDGEYLGKYWVSILREDAHQQNRLVENGAEKTFVRLPTLILQEYDGWMRRVREEDEERDWWIDGLMAEDLL